MLKTFKVVTEARNQAMDVTSLVESAISSDGGIEDGAVCVYCPHTTAGMYVNEGADPDVARDVIDALETLVPWNGPYRHAEGNSAAHIRSILTGNSVTVPVVGGRISLGTWQKIFLAEFDGPRTRNIQVCILRG